MYEYPGTSHPGPHAGGPYPGPAPLPGAAGPAPSGGPHGYGGRRTPSGLFPSGPVRPTYREPHPVHGAAVAAGFGGGAAWMLVFGLLGHNLSGYAWATIVAGAVAWAAALMLGRYGDRGVAAGVAISTAFGLSIATTVVAVRWMVSADWPLW